MSKPLTPTQFVGDLAVLPHSIFKATFDSGPIGVTEATTVATEIVLCARNGGEARDMMKNHRHYAREYLRMWIEMESVKIWSEDGELVADFSVKPGAVADEAPSVSPSGAVFRTITSDDWKRSIASARAAPNHVSNQIKAKLHAAPDTAPTQPPFPLRTTDDNGEPLCNP